MKKRGSYRIDREKRKIGSRFYSSINLSTMLIYGVRLGQATLDQVRLDQGRVVQQCLLALRQGRVCKRSIAENGESVNYACPHYQQQPKQEEQGCTTAADKHNTLWREGFVGAGDMASCSPFIYSLLAEYPASPGYATLQTAFFAFFFFLHPHLHSPRHFSTRSLPKHEWQ